MIHSKMSFVKFITELIKIVFPIVIVKQHVRHFFKLIIMFIVGERYYSIYHHEGEDGPGYIPCR